MKIEVTAEHIERARRLRMDGLRTTCCPIALALQLHVPRPVVARERVYYGDAAPGERPHAWLPLEAERFVQRFDNGEEVGPFAFDLDVTL